VIERNLGVRRSTAVTLRFAVDVSRLTYKVSTAVDDEEHEYVKLTRV
jgi:hypothetical protein